MRTETIFLTEEFITQVIYQNYAVSLKQESNSVNWGQNLIISRLRTVSRNHSDSICSL